MLKRWKAEVEVLASSVEVDHDETYTWVIAKAVPLPEGWNRPRTDVLVFIPPGYPQVPPDNFYVPAGLRLASGGTPNSFQPGNRTHGGEQWDMFSFHHEAGWHPTVEPEDGSNLVTFLTVVRKRLSELD